MHWHAIFRTMSHLPALLRQAMSWLLPDFHLIMLHAIPNQVKIGSNLYPKLGQFLEVPDMYFFFIHKDT